MNFVQRLKSLLARNHPTATVVEMRMPSGNVWVDINLCDTLFVVQYEPHRGFGVSAIHDTDGAHGLDGYGIGHDRYFARFSAAQLHLEKLWRRDQARSKNRTSLQSHRAVR